MLNAILMKSPEHETLWSRHLFWLAISVVFIWGMLRLSSSVQFPEWFDAIMYNLIFIIAFLMLYHFGYHFGSLQATGEINSKKIEMMEDRLADVEKRLQSLEIETAHKQQSL